MTRLIPKIGLEIHLELKTKSKMFCGCPNDSWESHPNTNICEICTGQPGTLPALNQEVVISALKLAKALNCQINKKSILARKNYFYPDLPKNYQISQYELPLAHSGFLEFYLQSELKKVRIRRIHLEEDTGKLLHFPNYTLVDFNRAGIPLIEIVTEPDIRSAEEAKNFAEELLLIIRYLQISTANPERGEIRFEANISLGYEDKLGTKVEVKNLGSLRSLRDAIEYEIKRQKEILEKNEKVVQETRGFDEEKRITFSQRKKELEQDYRYFPDPDLYPLILEDSLIEEIHLPELPLEKRKKLQEDYNLTFKEADILVKDKQLADLFENIISELQIDTHFGDYKIPYNLLVNDLKGLLIKYNKTLDDLDLKAYDLSLLIKKLINKNINIRMAKNLLEKSVKENANLSLLLKQQTIIIDPSQIRMLIKNILELNKKAVVDYKKGKENALQFLLGAIMRETKGQVDIETTKQILIEELKNA